MKDARTKFKNIVSQILVTNTFGRPRSQGHELVEIPIVANLKAGCLTLKA